MRHDHPYDDEPLFRCTADDFATSPAIRRWHRIVDWLGARRPLTLIASACAIIVAIQYVAHLIA
jgi:hypothetical protein